MLTLVHGKGNPNSPLVLQEMADIRDMCEFEARNSDATYWELFTPKLINREWNLDYQIDPPLTTRSNRRHAHWHLHSGLVSTHRNECYDVLHHLHFRHGRV